jgi:uncharacterized membrane protein YqjE
VASRPVVPIDPDAGIPDLIRRLVDDSRRLAQDEVRLAKIELRASAHSATRGGIWLGIAFGAGVVALVALTVLLTALLGGLLGNLWAGALVTAALWLGSAYLLVTRGLRQIKEQPFTLPETRHEARETVNLLKTVREPEVARQAREVRGALAGSSHDLRAVVDRLQASDRAAQGNGHGPR